MRAGEVGREAIQKSQERVQPIRKTFAYPFLGLLLSARLIAIMGETFFIRILSPRIAKEVPEIPLAVFLLVSFTTLALNRQARTLVPLLPFVQTAMHDQQTLPKSSVRCVGGCSMGLDAEGFPLQRLRRANDDLGFPTGLELSRCLGSY